MGIRINKSKASFINRIFKFYSFYLFIFIIFCLTFISVLFYEILELKRDLLTTGNLIHLVENVNKEERIRFVERCTFYTCFDVYKCDQSEDDVIKVYVYPEYKYVDSTGDPIILAYSREFRQIIDSIVSSKYYTDNPAEACLLIPNIDTLNQEKINVGLTSQILKSLPGWNNGKNHLLFNMVPGSQPSFSTRLEVRSSHALIAGAGLSTWSYRDTHDISIPLYNSFILTKLDHRRSKRWNRKWLLISSQPDLHHDYLSTLRTLNNLHILNNRSLLLLNACKRKDILHRCDDRNNVYKYPQILQQGTFCLVLRGNRLARSALLDCMAAGSIPVVFADPLVLPFQGLIDWPRASIVMQERELSTVLQQLSMISRERIRTYHRQVLFIYQKYFSSIESITQTTLRIINQRVFPYAADSYEEDNDRNSKPQSPLFLPVTIPSSQGFTAVILTYNRPDSLYKLIKQLSPISSLSKIIVVWNNQLIGPPPAELWPKVNKPLKVIQTNANKLSNRFYPYPEIETEAVLSFDDDILSLTSDEIEFAFEVWCHFPDRIVGFPSRLHVYDRQSKSWRYESEWVSSLSMVLTAAAFYHKHYNYLYTTSLPEGLVEWVDERMNCEDILFNFMVAHLSHQPPIKVTARQKFKCSNCSNTTLDVTTMMDEHMVERSECINYFVKKFNLIRPPLIPVEFRVDPLLYKESFPPTEFRRFNDIGSL